MKRFGQQLWYLLRTPKAIRMIVLGVALAIYVKTRSFLAVDQLVRIYREASQIHHNKAIRSLTSPHRKTSKTKMRCM